MDTLIKRKLNVLLHLAIVDGEFHQAEKSLIKSIIAEKGLDEDEFEFVDPGSELELGEMGKYDKVELIYLILKLVRADGVVMEQELAYCHDIVHKLNFDVRLVEDLVYMELPNFYKFSKLLLEKYQL